MGHVVTVASEVTMSDIYKKNKSFKYTIVIRYAAQNHSWLIAIKYFSALILKLID